MEQVEQTKHSNPAVSNQMDGRFRVALVVTLLFVFNQSCVSLNTQGMALLKFREKVARDPFGALSDWKYNEWESDPCSWSGVECSDGNIVILNLKDLGLGGTLTPELGKLTFVKSIILRNNSFSGNIPIEIGELEELEVLDLEYNNFSGPLPTNLGINLLLSILNAAQPGDPANIPHRGLLQVANTPRGSMVERVRHKRRRPRSPPFSSPSPSPSPSPFSSISFPPSPSISSPSDSPSSSPSMAPSPSPMLAPTPVLQTPVNPPVVVTKRPLSHPIPLHPHASVPSQSLGGSSGSNKHVVLIWSSAAGGSLFMFFAAVGVFVWRRTKVVTINPWSTGLSGQLQKAFVTGVPKLQRSELETACEDFSNIIGSLSDGMVYKGTLSTGVEIAVTSSEVKSSADWSKNLEAQFRSKIDTLSKVNHKNFVNLIGFCEEEKPFTRMMVFEYAPNGTLFEHLHIKEAEHLNWRMRLRIAMGMAYCLEYMHQLTPPISHNNLQSSSIYLTEDYAAKLSDFSFWNEIIAEKMDSTTMELLDTMSSDPESNVYSFGVILFEMITGRLPYSGDNGSIFDWASDYLRRERLHQEIVDPILESFDEQELEGLFEVIKGCVHPDPKQRLTMREVAGRLKEITTMGPDGATPKVSPLWWAELEILSTESN